MQIFLYEFSYFLASSLAILVSISAFALFILTFRYERQLRTVWRALGFLCLAFAFIVLILERKYPGVKIVAVLILALALYGIYRGVKAEPVLAPLLQVDAPGKERQDAGMMQKSKLMSSKSLIILIVALIIIALFLLPGYLYLGAYLPSIIEFIALLFVLATIRIQIKRYKADKKPINVYPMVGYIFLAIRGIAMVLYRLPDLNIVFLRMLSLQYSIAWIIAVVATFLAFVYLGIWAWKFVKVRPFLRTYVVFISMVVLVATVGALVFTLFIFKIIENNNLDLMQKGADTEAVIMNDRANTAMFIARLIAEDQRVAQSLKTGDYNMLISLNEKYLASSGVDILRIYSKGYEVVASPSDIRDQGRLFNNDKTLQFVMTENKQVRTFATWPGVLADYVVARALEPIIVDGQAIGIVETGYKFDNAFVDFSKEKTNLDVTIYTGTKISATTIKTQDQVSRYVGSEEVRTDVITNTLQQGKNYNTTIDRFGEIYYSAYSPIRDVNGQIIGMVCVGTPTYFLLEQMRQNLLTTFILVAIISAMISLLGYYLMPSLRIGTGQMAVKK
jgi:hypothetical protein